MCTVTLNIILIFISNKLITSNLITIFLIPTQKEKLLFLQVGYVNF